jgi:hypothetical protein
MGLCLSANAILHSHHFLNRNRDGFWGETRQNVNAFFCRTTPYTRESDRFNASKLFYS